jgi:hypothetical protein
LLGFTTEKEENHMSTPVERIVNLDSRTFEHEFVRTQKPVVLEGLTRNWPAYGRWTFDRAVAVGQTRKVPVAAWNGHPMGKGRSMTLQEYVALVRDNATARGQYYIAQTPIGQVLPELQQEIAAPPLFDASRLKHTFLFMGVDTYTAPHYHTMRNQAILAPIVGSKRVLLFAVSDHARLQSPPWFSTGKKLFTSNWSQLPFHRDAQLEDMAREFSSLQGVEPFECTLHPGDALFIPSHVFHIVYAMSESIAVTFFWRGKFPPAGVPFGLVARDVLSLGNRLLHVMVLKMAAALGVLEPLLARARRAGVLEDGDVEAVRDLIVKNGEMR